MIPEDPKNRYYYGMRNQNYYQNNMVAVPLNDPNDGNVKQGEFRQQLDGRQNQYYYSQMRNNEYKRFVGKNRVIGNNERELEHQIDPKIIYVANEII